MLYLSHIYIVPPTLSAIQTNRDICISVVKTAITQKYQCFVLWRKQSIPHQSPAPPPHSANKKKRFSGMRRFSCRAALLSMAHMVKVSSEKAKNRHADTIESNFIPIYPFFKRLYGSMLDGEHLFLIGAVLYYHNMIRRILL